MKSITLHLTDEAIVAVNKLLKECYEGRGTLPTIEDLDGSTLELAAADEEMMEVHLQVNEKNPLAEFVTFSFCTNI